MPQRGPKDVPRAVSHAPRSPRLALAPVLPRGLLCGAGVERSRGRGRSRGARESRSKTRHTETGIAVMIQNETTTTTTTTLLINDRIYSFSIPSTLFAPHLQLPPFRNSHKPLGHIAGISPPPPRYGACRSFSPHEKSSAVSCLVDSRRIVRTHARRFLHAISCTRKKKALSVGLELAKSAILVTRLNHYIGNRERWQQLGTPFDVVIHMRENPPLKRFSVGCSSPFMRLAGHLTFCFALECKQCLPGRLKPDMLRPGMVGMRESMAIRLPPCMT